VVIAFADKSSLRLTEVPSNFINAIVLCVEGKAARRPTLPPSWLTESSIGVAASNTFHRGQRNRGSAPTFVPPAVRLYPIHSGTLRTSGFPPVCLKTVKIWRLLPTCACLPKPLGIQPSRKEHVTKNCQICRSSLPRCSQPMPNFSFGRPGGDGRVFHPWHSIRILQSRAQRFESAPRLVYCM
jgi:hypothetical protein